MSERADGMREERMADSLWLGKSIDCRKERWSLVSAIPVLTLSHSL